MNPVGPFPILPSTEPQTSPIQEEERTFITDKDYIGNEASVSIVADQNGPDREGPGQKKPDELDDLSTGEKEEGGRSNF